MIKNKSVIKKLIIIGAVLFLVTVVAFYIYTLDYYKAEEEVNNLIKYDESIIVDNSGMIVIYPEIEPESNIGLIFYPGGKVEFEAYIPIFKEISEYGITCILVEMPFNLAVFDVKAADKLYAKFPNIENWYLSGHSLGGAMASSYVEKNYDKLEGLILLGAYPINNANISTLAIYGSEDEGLDLSKLGSTENKYEIYGGNHAYFGNYGEQDGDGVATISREEQQKISVGLIVEFIKNIDDDN